MPGLSLKSKGSEFGRVYSIQDRRVRGLIAWAFLKSRGSKFFSACARFKVEGFEVLSPGLFWEPKGSRFGRVFPFRSRRVRGLVAW